MKTPEVERQALARADVDARAIERPAVEPFDPPPPMRWRWAWWALAYASLGLGLVGIVVPGLPTVPLILLSAFAATRGSQRLHRWLLAHPRFGRMIRDWQSHGAVARRVKWQATVMMGVCAAILWLVAPMFWLAMAGAACMASVALWLWRRPEPPRAGPDSAMTGASNEP